MAQVEFSERTAQYIRSMISTQEREKEAISDAISTISEVAGSIDDKEFKNICSVLGHYSRLLTMISDNNDWVRNPKDCKGGGWHAPERRQVYPKNGEAVAAKKFPYAQFVKGGISSRDLEEDHLHDSRGDWRNPGRWQQRALDVWGGRSEREIYWIQNKKKDMTTWMSFKKIIIVVLQFWAL